MIKVRFSDKLREFYGDIRLTADGKLLLFHQTNKPFTMDEVNPKWFPNQGVDCRLGLHDAVVDEHRNFKPAKYVMVMSLDLKEVCRTPGTTIEQFLYGFKMNKNDQPFLEFEEWYDHGHLIIRDYELMKPGNPYVTIKHYFHTENCYERTSSLWKEMCDCPIVCI